MCVRVAFLRLVDETLSSLLCHDPNTLRTCPTSLSPCGHLGNFFDCHLHSTCCVVRGILRPLSHRIYRSLRCVCKCKLNVSFPLWRNGDDDVPRPTTSSITITISNATTGRRQASPGEQPPKCCCCCCCCCQGRQFGRVRVNHSSGEARRVPWLDFDILAAAAVAVVVVVLIVVSLYVCVCVCRHPSEPTTQQQPLPQPQPEHCPRPVPLLALTTSPPPKPTTASGC